VSHAGTATEEPDPHVLLLCRDEDHRRSSLAAWIQRGLDGGDKVLCTELPGDTALAPALLEHQVDMRAAVGLGRLSVLSLEDFYPRGGPEVLVRDALDEGYPRVRLAVMAEAALGYLGAEGYQAAERQVDRLCASLPVFELCQYDVSGAAAGALATVMHSHPDAVTDDQMHLSRHGAGLRVAGEVDFDSAAALSLALPRMCEVVGASDLTVDLSAMGFVDVAGCRALCQGTEGFRSSGRSVSLQDAQPHVHRVMTLLALDRVDNVRLGEGCDVG
jgi:anti-anti-sigma factor